MLETLSANQRLALDLAATFFLIFPELASAWFPDLSPNALAKLFRRLVGAGLLLRHPWGAGRNYFVLTRRAVRLLELPHRRTAPLGWEALIQAVGACGACVEADLEKLTAAEFVADFPDLVGRGIQAGAYALAPDDTLVSIIVDHGAPAFGLAQKAHKAVRQRRRVQALRELIDAGAFSLLIATTPEKAAEVAEAVAKDPPEHAPVRVVAVPLLTSLILKKGDRR